ncbi:MAG: SusC/RagA family TonB-linked outer membrane protein [Flavobacteriaceae bacterium]
MKINPKKEVCLNPIKVLQALMKTVVLLCFSTVFGFSTNSSFSQNASININSNKSVSIQEVFELIKTQTKYSFVYNDDMLANAPEIKLKKGEITVKELLKNGLTPINCTYEFYEDDSTIIVQRNTEAPKTIQQHTVNGTVTDKDGVPLPGTNILEKGTTNGALTDFDGKFSLDVSNPNATLVISYIGFATLEVSLNGKTSITATLQEDAQSLDEVVVTALGISREKKTLTYSAQEVNNDDLTRVKQTNVINSLSGKTAGVTISKSASGVGGSSKVVLRGNSSTTNNDPLYVVDGVPLSNSGNGFDANSSDDAVFGGDTGNRDGGDVLSLINPDDIESMTVLKGASAAALYGSQGANGVILITTKSGKEGKVSVTFNSNITIDNAYSLPELQSEYQSLSVGQAVAANGAVADPRSWGAKTSGLKNDYAKDFFRTGFTSIQSLSLSAGNQKAQTYFSFANTLANGIMPENGMKRNNLTLRETAKFLNDKINVSASVNLSDQRITNRSTTGLRSNALGGLYLNPVGIDFNYYKNNFEYFNEAQNMMNQYATTIDNIQSNPYWVIYRQPSKDIAQRAMLSSTISYDITDNFALKTRLSYDKSFFTYDKRYYGSSSPNFVPSTGRYILDKTENTQQYIDLIASYNPTISDNFTFSGLLGTSLLKSAVGDKLYLDSGASVGGLTYPNEFTIGNFVNSASIYQEVFNREVQSIFGSANFGFKDMLFLDITGRKDWSSTLVNTDSNSFFYPSVGLTGVLSQMVNFPDAISFAKLRLSYAEVGKDVPVYATVPINTIPAGQYNTSRPTFGIKQGETLKPERQKGFEIGTEWRFFQNRLGIDFTYYDSKTSDQIFYITAEPNVEGYTQNIVNAGEISNKGIEFVLSGKPIVNENGFNWDTNINFAQNKNKVISVHPDLDNGEAVINLVGSPNGYGFSLIEGEDFGSIRGYSVERNENGLPIATESNGTLTLNKTDVKTIASYQPDFTLGWKNSFTYKNLSIEFLIDAKIGGDVISATEAINDFYGVSQTTANARNTNGGMIDVVDQDGNATQMTAEAYYTQIGGRDGIFGEYVYDATNVSLRELSIGYNLPIDSKFFNTIRLSLVGSNLFFFYKDAPFDPNLTASNGIGMQGIDIYGQPTTRSLGFNINVNF